MRRGTQACVTCHLPCIRIDTGTDLLIVYGKVNASNTKKSIGGMMSPSLVTCLTTHNEEYRHLWIGLGSQMTNPAMANVSTPPISILDIDKYYSRYTFISLSENHLKATRLNQTQPKLTMEQPAV